MALNSITIYNGGVKTCSCCNLDYDMYNQTSSFWFKAADKNCMFCFHYNGTLCSRTDMYEGIEYSYLWSGSVDRAAYYKQYLRLVNRWCDNLQIPFTDEEKETCNKLEKIQNWSRNYWN
jgi:hypothetical protein